MKAILFVPLIFLVASTLGAEPPAAGEGKKTPAPEKSSSPTSLLGDLKGNPKEPTTTEIYADEAFFDSGKNVGIFTGHVKVTDPRFNLQSDKLTVFISKGENQGLEKAVAEGNVGVVRDRPDPNGGPPSRAVGRSDIATYIAATGDVELRGTPRVQQGENTHVATSPDTIMVLNQKGQLTTHGASRTDIRQQPKDDDKKDSDKKGNETAPKAGSHKDASKPETTKSPGK